MNVNIKQSDAPYSPSYLSIMQILFNCIDERRLRMLLSSGMVSTPQLMCPENQELRKEHLSVADTVEPIEQCPILNDYVQARIELSFPFKNYVSLSSGTSLSTDLVSYFFRGKVESLSKLKLVFVFPNRSII